MTIAVCRVRERDPRPPVRQAANWQYLGGTQGHGKLDIRHCHDKPIKSVWVYPLEKHFRQTPCRPTLLRVNGGLKL